MDVENCRLVDGLWMHKMFHESILRSVFSYKPRPDDVFVVTYPKCGTTWIQYIVLSIFNKGDPPTTKADFLLASPFLDFMGAEAAEKMARPGVLKTHLPFHKTPFSDDAKYIYVARNPYDVCVSFYYHLKAFTPKTVKDASFARFHELFISDRLSWGPYFDHLFPWYAQRDLPNVLYFTYEQARKDTALWVLKIADFLRKHYGDQLRNDSALLQKVLDVCSLENMRRVFDSSAGGLLKNMLNLPPEKALKSLDVYRDMDIMVDTHESLRSVRKGTVGDWRTHFTCDEIEKTKQWIHRKTEGSDVMELWNDINLP
ncbi:sulfotransferase 1C2-like [Dermacentor silvarum]|uniref:sulfotransferase 1C2-like n=1 Tax=Dermacentor silvarum TaxID=543639 RepID=UPI0021015222|nr:sulfotransferase 1C2-like [Dermacentor silvarum]